MVSLKQTAEKYWKEFRTNRRLQYGFAAILVIGLLELCLDWNDRLAAERKTLSQLRGEISTLRQQTNNPEALRRTIADLERISGAVDRRLWVASSDAVGQARIKDWLSGVLVDAGAANATLDLTVPRPFTPKKDEPSATTALDTSLSPVIQGAESPAKAAGLGALREYSARMSFVFTPESLERILAAVEGGETLSKVDTLVISRRNRRVEIGVLIVMRIGKQYPASAQVLESTDMVGQGKPSTTGANP